MIGRMSPRPREKTDTDLLEGTMRVINRLGPARMTLAEVATEVGMAPATLMQRFGSKRGLLLAVARHGAETVGEQFEQIRKDYDSALAALGAVATCMTRMVETPETLANSLAFLQMDLADPEFHRHALAHSRAMRVEIRTLLDSAIDAGELTPCDTRRLARAIHGLLNGSLLTWAVDRDGAVEKRVREDLEILIAPRRPARRPAPRKSRR
jgi:AcrR family transcriptional regulator